jgi:hypothetical protein
MFETDRLVYEFIELLQAGKDSYKLFTTIPDFMIDANFQKTDNDNYELLFTLQPNELKKGLDLDYFFQRPFLLVSNRMKILVQNYDITSGKQGILEDSPCNFKIEVKAFKGDTDDDLWEQSKQKAYFKCKKSKFIPHKSGVLFDLTTKAKDNGDYNAIILKIDNVELLFYYESITSEDGYYIFIPKESINFNKFQRIIHVIITSYGFLNGFLLKDTVYYFAQKEINKRGLITFRYENFKESFYSKYPILDSGHYNDISNEDLQLTCAQFNHLVNLLYTNEEYFRAALLLISAGRLDGCDKASLGAVSLETITKEVWKDSTQKIIEDKELNQKIRDQLKRCVESFSEQLTKKQLDLLKNKIDQINNKPNSDKLEDPFLLLNIPLDEDDLFCIDCRNRLLHGNLPRRKKDMCLSDEELLDLVANRIVLLSSMLLLKLAGYTGLVIDWGMTKIIKWRMIKNGEKVTGGNSLRRISSLSGNQQ